MDADKIYNNEFEILATFAVEKFLRDVLEAARDCAKKKSKTSVTDAYINVSQVMVNSMANDKKYYADMFKRFRDYYARHNGSSVSAARVQEIEEIYVRLLVPESHLQNLSDDQRSSVVHDAIASLFAVLGKYVTKPNNLRKIIDGKSKSFNVEVFQDVAYDALCEKKKKCYDAFLREIHNDADDEKNREIAALKEKIKKLESMVATLETKLADAIAAKQQIDAKYTVSVVPKKQAPIVKHKSPPKVKPVEQWKQPSPPKHKPAEQWKQPSPPKHKPTVFTAGSIIENFTSADDNSDDSSVSLSMGHDD